MSTGPTTGGRCCKARARNRFDPLHCSHNSTKEPALIHPVKFSGDEGDNFYVINHGEVEILVDIQEKAVKNKN